MKVMVVKTTVYKAAICLLTGQKFKSRREKKKQLQIWEFFQPSKLYVAKHNGKPFDNCGDLLLLQNPIELQFHVFILALYGNRRVQFSPGRGF